MTKGKYDTKELLNNHGVVSLFGYLVRCNKQVHDFQNRVIKEYLVYSIFIKMHFKYPSLVRNGKGQKSG